MRGELGSGVRDIIIYPMNALANDQMKRMRSLLKRHPAITFGLYNGNTEHTQTKALETYRRTLQTDLQQGEIISREEMQRTPPHILITSYSMLEYMMLRPKDDAVFRGARLRYIVLDEAHIYKGATGMETSLLMRRPRARNSEPDSVQYILTSATLGGPEADGDILAFAHSLCDADFKPGGIIRSKEKRPPMEEERDFPPELFRESCQSPGETGAILARYGADFAPEGDAGEKLYALFLHARLFALLRQAAAQPITVAQLCRALSVTEEEVVDLVSLCARAERDGASLIKPRYHFFVRAMEGAYVTLAVPKRLYLQRKLADPETGRAVFEGAVCTDCDRLAVVGREEGGYLKQTARKGAKRMLSSITSAKRRTASCWRTRRMGRRNSRMGRRTMSSARSAGSSPLRRTADSSVLVSTTRRRCAMWFGRPRARPGVPPAALAASAGSTWGRRRLPLCWAPSSMSNCPARRWWSPRLPPPRRGATSLPPPPNRVRFGRRPPGSSCASPTAAARPPILPLIWNAPTRSFSAAGGCGTWRSSSAARAGPPWG